MSQVDFGGGATATTNGDGLLRTRKPAGSSADERPIVARLRRTTTQWWNRAGARNPPPTASLWYVSSTIARCTDRARPLASRVGSVKLTLSRRRPAGGDSPRHHGQHTAQPTGTGTKSDSGSVELNALGGFDFAVEIPGGANLGRAWIQLIAPARVAATTTASRFRSFAAPSSRSPPAPESAGPYIVGKPATVGVQGRLLLGRAAAGRRSRMDCYHPPGDLLATQLGRLHIRRLDPLVVPRLRGLSRATSTTRTATTRVMSSTATSGPRAIQPKLRPTQAGRIATVHSPPADGLRR